MNAHSPRQRRPPRSPLARTCACIPAPETPYGAGQPEYFAALGDVFASRGFDVVLTGVPAERDCCARVESLMRAPSVNLCGKTDLGALGALIGNAALLVSNDTGVVHLAVALRTPSVTVHVQPAEKRSWEPVDVALHRLARPATPERVLAEALSLMATPRELERVPA